MDTRELARIDLNLLISLQVLLEEQSVSRAAERLYITQPAMSKTLSRLRKVFGDPLFTRRSHGMQPTPRAQALARGLSEILAGIGQLVSSPGFDPARADGEITIALSEYIGVTLLPALAARLQRQAPHLNIRIITRVENQLEQLATGNLDFALQMRQARYGPEFRVAELGESPPVLLARSGHPLTEGRLDWERLGQYPVIRPYISDQDQLAVRDTAWLFDRLRLPGQGSLEISHLMTAMEVLRTSDYYMPGPAYILQNARISQDITALSLPGEEDYAVYYVLVAHRRTDNSPLHNWLWEEITCTIRDLRPDQPRKLRQRVAAGSADHR